MSVPSAVIKVDMEKVQNSIKMCIDSISNYENAKKVKRSEQQDLQVLIRNPGYYNVEALKKNVDRCDIHIEEYDKVIEKERNSIKTYQNIYSKLQVKLEEKQLEEANGNQNGSVN